MTTEERERLFLDISDGHKALIAKVCYLYSSASASFDDLYQEVLINLWNGLDSYRGDARVSTWLYRLAINTCISWHRRNDRHGDNLSLDDITAEPADDPDSRNVAEDVNYLHSLISRLDPLEKAVVTLWLDEKPYDEIALITGISRANVAVKLHRIKEKLSHFAHGTR